jgi:hypothetical protein
MSFLDDTKLKNVASVVTKIINDAALVTEETINLVNTKSGKKIRVNRQDADKYKPFGFVIEELDTDITENFAADLLAAAKHVNPRAKIVTPEQKKKEREEKDEELDKKHGDKPVVASVTSGSFGKNRGYGQGRYMGDSVEHNPFSDLIEAYTKNGMAGLIECINNKQKIEDDVITEGRPSEQHALEGHPYHSKPDHALNYIIKDAGSAAKAMQSIDNKEKESKYLDQQNDASTVLQVRKQHGTSNWYNKKYNNPNKTNINDSVEVTTTPQHKTFKQINEIRAGKKKVIPVDKFEKNPILSSEIVKDT